MTATGDYMMADGTILAADSTEATVSSYLPMVGAAIGAYTLYQMGQRWGEGRRDTTSVVSNTAGGALAGAAVGNQVGGYYGAAVGAVVGAIYGFASTYIRAGKHKDQLARDAVRGSLQELKLIDDDYQITLADGSKWDMGKDGGKRDQADGTNRRPYEVNFENPLAAEAVSLANPLATILVGGNEKLTSDFAGYLANAAMSNAKSGEDVLNNIMAFYKQLNVGAAEMLDGIEKLKADGKISQNQYDVYRSSVIKALGQPPGPGGGSLPNFGGGGVKISIPDPGPSAPMSPPESEVALQDPGKGVDGAAIFQNALRSMLGNQGGGVAAQ